MLFHPHTHLLNLILLICTGCEAAPLSTPRLSCQVENSVETTILTASVKGSDATAKLRIDWLTANETPENFTSRPAQTSSQTSSYRLGKTTLTRTILASTEADCLFIHIHADQPGPVHFTTRFLSEKPTELRNRREIILRDPEISAHAWVIPFESDVEDDGKGKITVSGEGEALIIFNLSTYPAKQPTAETLERLGKKYDPSRTPPNPHLIWKGVKPRE